MTKTARLETQHEVFKSKISNQKKLEERKEKEKRPIWKFQTKPNPPKLFADYDRRNQRVLNALDQLCFRLELSSRCVLQAELPRARNQE